MSESPPDKGRLLVLNQLPWYARVPVKFLVLGLTVFLVCFPYPAAFRRHTIRLMNPNMLVEPDHPQVAALHEELKPRLLRPDGTRIHGKAALPIVERFVYERIPYEWDWVNWGMADYLPTLDELFEKGREDCDGRAVVAASLLTRAGFKARLVSDFTHVWVETEAGETMGPRETKVLVATDEGMKVQARFWPVVRELASASGYGISVFPWARELIVLIVLWYLLLHRRTGIPAAVFSLAALAGALWLLRIGGTDHQNPRAALQWAGVALGLLAVLGLVIAPLLRKRAAEPFPA